MTPEEALHDIISSGINLGAGDFVDVEALKVACVALEKQIPKKVNKFFKAPDGYLSNGDCPSCKERVDEGTMYCEACGQAIDWSDKR